jgi:hypothetical protein
VAASKDTATESGAKASGSEPSESKPKKAETYSTRHAANVAFFQLDGDKRAGLKVGRDPKTGLFSIVARGK